MHATPKRRSDSMGRTKRSIPRLAATSAVIVGLAAGSYGVASGATGNSSASTTTATTATRTTANQRGNETALSGDALAKVTAAAKAELPGATIDRVETDADGNAAYEAHVTKSDGTDATAYVDARIKVVSGETGGLGGRRGPGAQRGDETPLTGDALAKVTAAANAELPGATIDRVETDADGNAAYEAHVTKSDGTDATAYV